MLDRIVYGALVTALIAISGLWTGNLLAAYLAVAGAGMAAIAGGIREAVDDLDADAPVALRVANFFALGSWILPLTGAAALLWRAF